MITTPRTPRTGRTSLPASARSTQNKGRASQALRGRLVLEASTTNARSDDPQEEFDEDEEFRLELRKQVKQRLTERRLSTPRERKAGAGANSVGVGGSRHRGPNVTAQAVLAPPSGLDVHPSYFDYTAATRELLSKAKPKNALGDGENEAATFKEMVAFLSSQGLSGPVRAYAKSLAVQGVHSPHDLILAETTRLSRLLHLSQLDTTDELLLLDALRQLLVSPVGRTGRTGRTGATSPHPTTWEAKAKQKMEDDQENEHPVRNLVLSVCDLKQHGDVPAARCGSQTVTMNTRMYLHGGCDDKKAYGDLHLLEIEQMKWTELQCEGTKDTPDWRIQAKKRCATLSSQWKLLTVAPERGGFELQRIFEFRDFQSAFGFMSRVAIAADKADHHPNWSNVYSTVDVKLWTHDAPGLTEKDFALAAQMDQIAASSGLVE
eukprot:symbB.v1.2.000098.t1/scaffold13.1/size649204/9